MGAMSWLHWLIIAVPFLLLVGVPLGVPAARILKRAGFSPWWCLVAIVPLVNLLALWVFAFVDWPALDKSKADGL
jgi:hypothetical protein